MVLGGSRSTQHQLVSLMKHKPKPGSMWIRTSGSKKIIVTAGNIRYGKYHVTKDFMWVEYTAVFTNGKQHNDACKLSAWFRINKPYET